MILVSSNVQSEKFNNSHVERFAECDEVYGYSECGWYNLAGYRGEHRTRVLHCHAGSFEEMRSAFAWRGYDFDGHAVRKLTPEEIEERRNRSYDDGDDYDSNYPRYGRR